MSNTSGMRDGAWALAETACPKLLLQSPIGMTLAIALTTTVTPETPSRRAVALHGDG
jgi:hypothetical protein